MGARASTLAAPYLHSAASIRAYGRLHRSPIGPPQVAAAAFLIAFRIRTFAPALQSSSQFPCRPRSAFGRPAASRNAPAPASRLPALGPMLRCRTLRPTARCAPRQAQSQKADEPSRPPTNGGGAPNLIFQNGLLRNSVAGRLLLAEMSH